MSESEIQPAPVISWPKPPDDKWQREYQAFLAMLPRLLPTHRHKYVAVHEGQVVDSGDDQVALGLRVYDRFGYEPIYVGLVDDPPQQTVRLPAPRIIRSNRLLLDCPPLFLEMG